MALKTTDLFVVQDSSTKDLYKVSAAQLGAAIEGGSGVNFRGSVDLLTAMTGQLDPDPAINGDLYIVERDAPTINNTWTMANGETQAFENDRVIWDANDGGWVLVTGGNNTGGTIVEVQGQVPITIDDLADATRPIVKIREATTSLSGSVKRLAGAADVVDTNLNPPTDAVVTADLLQATNKEVADLLLSPGGVTKVSSDDVNSNAALTISPNVGDVKVEIKTATEPAYGVVSLASAQDVIDGTAGAGAVVDAAQLKTVSDSIPGTGDFGVMTITEGGTDIVANALEIGGTTSAVTIGVAADTFCPADFEALPDIDTAP